MLRLLGITLIKSAKQRLALMVNPERASLIKWFSLMFSGSSSQAAAHLTDIAIEKKYIAKRKAPPGEMLKHWVKNNDAPQWACRSAFDYLIAHHWTPTNESQRAIAARYLLLNKHPISKQWVEQTGQWLDIAYQAQQENK